MRYVNRAHAGLMLAEEIRRRGQLRSNTVILGMARGGLPVAAVVARQLALPLEVLVVRKLGVPEAPEVAFGAVGPGAIQVINHDIAARMCEQDTMAVVRRETTELLRREQLYRAGRPVVKVKGHDVLIVDDGLATGASARVGVAVVRTQGACRVLVAVPVASTEATAILRRETDGVICHQIPPVFAAVGSFYTDFHQVSDAEVADILASWGAVNEAVTKEK